MKRAVLLLLLLLASPGALAQTSPNPGDSIAPSLTPTHSVFGRSSVSTLTDIRSFGAVCNGTDQNAAVQAALATGVKRIFLPRGCMWIAPGGLIPAGITLIGEDSSSTGSVVKSSATLALALTVGAGAEFHNINAQGATVNSPTDCPMKHYSNVSLYTQTVISTCYEAIHVVSGEDATDRTGVFFLTGAMSSGATGDALNVSNCGGVGGCSFTGNSLRADNYSGVAGNSAILVTAMPGSASNAAIIQSTNYAPGTNPVHYAIFETNRTGGVAINLTHRTSNWASGSAIAVDGSDDGTGTFAANFMQFTSNNHLYRFGVDSAGGVRTSSTVAMVNTSNAVQSYFGDNGTGFYFASDASGTMGVIMNHGTNVWISFSDARLPEKQNARPVRVLDKLAGMRLVEYGKGHEQLGVIAQEFVKVFPQLVKKGDDTKRTVVSPFNDPGVWGVAYDRIGVVALQGVKELLSEVTVLRARVNELERRK